MTDSFYLSDLIGIPVISAYAKSARDRELKELSDTLYSSLFQGLDIPSVNPSENYKCVGKRYQVDKKSGKFFLDKLAGKTDEFLAPVTVFHNEVSEYYTEPQESVYSDKTKKVKEFYVSVGIFDLDVSTATVVLTKNNNLKLTWKERAGNGEFVSRIPSYLIPTSTPVMSYQGGVLDIRVPVKSKDNDGVLFVGKLTEQK